MEQSGNATMGAIFESGPQGINREAILQQLVQENPTITNEQEARAEWVLGKYRDLLYFDQAKCQDYLKGVDPKKALKKKKPEPKKRNASTGKDGDKKSKPLKNKEAQKKEPEIKLPQVDDVNLPGVVSVIIDDNGEITYVSQADVKKEDDPDAAAAAGDERTAPLEESTATDKVDEHDNNNHLELSREGADPEDENEDIVSGDEGFDEMDFDEIDFDAVMTPSRHARRGSIIRDRGHRGSISARRRGSVSEMDTSGAISHMRVALMDRSGMEMSSLSRDDRGIGGSSVEHCRTLRDDSHVDRSGRGMRSNDSVGSRRSVRSSVSRADSSAGSRHSSSRGASQEIDGSGTSGGSLGGSSNSRDLSTSKSPRMRRRVVGDDNNHGKLDAPRTPSRSGRSVRSSSSGTASRLSPLGGLSNSGSEHSGRRQVARSNSSEGMKEMSRIRRPVRTTNNGRIEITPRRKKPLRSASATDGHTGRLRQPIRRSTSSGMAELQLRMSQLAQSNSTDGTLETLQRKTSEGTSTAAGMDRSSRPSRESVGSRISSEAARICSTPRSNVRRCIGTKEITTTPRRARSASVGSSMRHCRSLSSGTSIDGSNNNHFSTTTTPRRGKRVSVGLVVPSALASLYKDAKPTPQLADSSKKQPSDDSSQNNHSPMTTTPRRGGRVSASGPDQPPALACLKGEEGKAIPQLTDTSMSKSCGAHFSMTTTPRRGRRGSVGGSGEPPALACLGDEVVQKTSQMTDSSKKHSRSRSDCFTTTPRRGRRGSVSGSGEPPALVSAGDEEGKKSPKMTDTSKRHVRSKSCEPSGDDGDFTTTPRRRRVSVRRSGLAPGAENMDSSKSTATPGRRHRASITSADLQVLRNLSQCSEGDGTRPDDAGNRILRIVSGSVASEAIVQADPGTEETKESKRLNDSSRRRARSKSSDSCDVASKDAQLTKTPTRRHRASVSSSLAARENSVLDPECSLLKSEIGEGQKIRTNDSGSRTRKPTNKGSLGDEESENTKSRGGQSTKTPKYKKKLLANKILSNEPPELLACSDELTVSSSVPSLVEGGQDPSQVLGSPMALFLDTLCGPTPTHPESAQEEPESGPRPRTSSKPSQLTDATSKRGSTLAGCASEASSSAGDASSHGDDAATASTTKSDKSVQKRTSRHSFSLAAGKVALTLVTIICVLPLAGAWMMPAPHIASSPSLLPLPSHVAKSQSAVRTPSLLSSLSSDEATDKDAATSAAAAITGLTLKVALDANGGVAELDPDASKVRLFTCSDSLDMVHRLRRDSDAVLVGRGTVKADDCSLLVRRGVACDTQPARVILDPRLSLLLDKLNEGVDYQVLTDGAPTIVYHCIPDYDTSSLPLLETVKLEYVSSQPRTDVSPEGFRPGRYISPRAVLDNLKSNYQIEHLMVEGGPFTARNFLEEQLVDRAIVVNAPIRFEEPLLSGITAQTLRDAGLVLLGSRPSGVDTIDFWARPGEAWPTDSIMDWP